MYENVVFHDPTVSYVHVVNRTTRPITGTFDGRQVDLAPAYMAVEKRDERGVVVMNRKTKQPEIAIVPRTECPPKHLMINGVIARAMPAPAAKLIISQHPVMGTQAYGAPLPSDFYLGLIEMPQAYPVTYRETSGAKELLDASTLPAASRKDRMEIEGDGRIPMQDRRINSAEVSAIDSLSANL